MMSWNKQQEQAWDEMFEQYKSAPLSLLRQKIYEAVRAKDPELQYIQVVFDGPPGPEGGRFVEVENHMGKSMSVGHWAERTGGFHVLVLPRYTVLQMNGEQEHAVDKLLNVCRTLLNNYDTFIGHGELRQAVLDAGAAIGRDTEAPAKFSSTHASFTMNEVHPVDDAEFGMREQRGGGGYPCADGTGKVEDTLRRIDDKLQDLRPGDVVEHTHAIIPDAAAIIDHLHHVRSHLRGQGMNSYAQDVHHAMEMLRQAGSVTITRTIGSHTISEQYLNPVPEGVQRLFGITDRWMRSREAEDCRDTVLELRELLGLKDGDSLSAAVRRLKQHHDEPAQRSTFRCACKPDATNTTILEPCAVHGMWRSEGFKDVVRDLQEVKALCQRQTTTVIDLEAELKVTLEGRVAVRAELERLRQALDNLDAPTIVNGMAYVTEGEGAVAKPITRPATLVERLHLLRAQHTAYVATLNQQLRTMRNAIRKAISDSHRD
jgi:hypothetical protein